MAELTFKVELPREFAVAGSYAELVQAGLAFIGLKQRDVDRRWIFEGTGKDRETFGNLCAAGVRRCQVMEAAIPLALAPRSSADVIVELTEWVAAMSNPAATNHRARRRAEKAMAEVWKLAGASVAEIDKKLAAMSAAETGQGGVR